MDLKIVKKKDNPLLSRKEIELETSFFGEATPKKEDIKKKIASVEKADEKLVVVKHVFNEFGAGKANVLAYVYTSEEELKKTELKKRGKKGAKPAEEETPKEETKKSPKEEAPEKEAKKE